MHELPGIADGKDAALADLDLGAWLLVQGIERGGGKVSSASRVAHYAKGPCDGGRLYC